MICGSIRTWYLNLVEITENRRICKIDELCQNEVL